MVNVYIWGCGIIGDAIGRGLDLSKCNVVFCDTNRRGNIDVGDAKIDIVSPEEIQEQDVDFIFPGSEAFEKEIIERIRQKGIKESKIIPVITDFNKIGKVQNLFTINGFQFVLSLQNQYSFKQLNTKIDNLIEKQDILSRILAGKRHIAKRVKSIGLINLNSILNIPERVISKSTESIINKYLESNNYCNYEINSIDMLSPDLNLLEMCDVIVFAGGGIIKLDSAKMDFTGSIDKITTVADALDIPVMFVGVGVEECDRVDEYRKMQRALNRDCVKVVSVRENLPAMKKYIYNPNIVVELVADAALNSAEVYGIAKKETNIIGIGTINFANWELNGHAIPETELLAFYKDLITEIEEKGFEWRLFSNGTRRDYEFAEQITLMDSRYKDCLIPKLKTDIEWMEVMSGFCGIVAPRLHTNIVAHSFGIPCVGLVWNNKVKSFYEMLGMVENAFEPDCFEATKVVNQLICTRESPAIYKKNVEIYQKKTVDLIGEFLDKYLEK